MQGKQVEQSQEQELESTPRAVWRRWHDVKRSDSCNGYDNDGKMETKAHCNLYCFFVKRTSMLLPFR